MDADHSVPDPARYPGHMVAHIMNDYVIAAVCAQIATLVLIVGSALFAIGLLVGWVIA
jgi:uncharacterized membrane protein YciS (DUF1049 family)